MDCSRGCKCKQENHLNQTARGLPNAESQAPIVACSALQRALGTRDFTHVQSQMHRANLLPGTTDCPDRPHSTEQGCLLGAGVTSCVPGARLLLGCPCCPGPDSFACLQTCLQQPVYIHPHEHLGACQCFQTGAGSVAKKQDGCEDKKNHGNLNFTPSLKIPSSSSWMPPHTVCKVPGLYTAVAVCLGKPGSRAQHFFGYTARLDSCSDLQLNLLWLQSSSIPCTVVVDVQVSSTNPLYLAASLMQTLQQNVGSTQPCSGSSEVGHAAPQESTATKNGFYYAGPQRCFHKRRKKNPSAFSV